MAWEPLTAVLDIGGKIIERIWPDPAQRDAAKLELLKMQQTGELAALQADLQIAVAQAATNTAEAQSGSPYAAGWRPTVGYICAAALAWTFIGHPMAEWAAALAGKTISAPTLHTDGLMELVMGMLGLGGMRTWEKVKGAQK